MLINASQMEAEFRENMRGGEGTVRITNILNEKLPSKCRLFAHITLPPGGSIGFHNHDAETEVYYFLNGEGVVDDHGEEKHVAPGDAMHTGGGLGHSVQNTGSNNLEFLAVIILD